MLWYNVLSLLERWLLFLNYDRVILELLDRVCQLEEEVAALKKQCASPADAASAPAVASPLPGTRDTTKYELNGERYGKSRVALAIVREYLRRNPSVGSFDELNQVFDKSLQGSLGVVRLLDDVKSAYSAYEKRFFCADDEILQLGTDRCVVCSQWSIHNISRLIEYTEIHLGIHVHIL